jgi:phage/plasmid-associated DNA primase
MPLVKNNVSLIKGSFSDTLPEWLNKNSKVFSFINIDCDTYESTSTVLNSIGPTRIATGTYILFDEYFGFPGWKNHEFKAWQEYCTKNNVKYKYVALCNLQVLIEVL